MGRNDLPASVDNVLPLTTTFGKGSEFELTNLFITVVSASPEDKLASYSQICVAAQAYCLTALGGDINYYYNNGMSLQEALEKGGIYSTVQANDQHKVDETGSAYGYMQGTSMATPVVTGSAALLMGAFPHLTSQEVVEILFRTANKEGLVGWTNDGTWTDSKGNEYATSSIFGHGMVDLERATQPLGELMLPAENSVNGSKFKLNGTKLEVPRIFGSSLSDKLPAYIVGLDDYNRAFPISMNLVVRQAHRSSDDFKRSFRSFMNRNKIQIAGVKDKMSFAFSSSMTDDNLLGMGKLDMNYAFSDNQFILFSYRSDVLREEFYFDQVLSNPFINMTDAYALKHQFNLNKKISLSFGATLGKNGFFEGDEDLGEEYDRSVNAFHSELVWHPSEKMAFKAIAGMISEKDSVLGLNGSGMFKTDTARTYFIGAAIEIHPIKSLTLSVAYYYGRSMIPRTSTLVSLNQMISDSLAVDVRYCMDKRMVGVQLSSPLRIRQGTASFNLPIGRDGYDEVIYRNQFDVSLKPKAREYNLGFYYIQDGDFF